MEFAINSNLCTRLEAINCYEILGCALAQLLKFDEAVLIWRKALVYRYNQHILKLKRRKKVLHFKKLLRSIEPKIKKIADIASNQISFKLEKEFETEEDLEKIIFDPNLIILQSIAIMERYYGSNHLITFKYLSER